MGESSQSTVTDAGAEYAVEFILGKKSSDGHEMYLVKWQDYPIEEATWEPAKNLHKCGRLLRSFERLRRKEPDADERMEDEVLYEAESIIQKKVTSGRPFYLVKWKDYPMNQCTWEPPEHLMNCTELIAEFESTQENQKVVQVRKKPGRKRKRRRNSVPSRVTQQPSCDRGFVICDRRPTDAAASSAGELRTENIPDNAERFGAGQNKAKCCFRTESTDDGSEVRNLR